MSLLNAKLKDLTPYEPLQGEYKIRLDANESFIALPSEKREQIAEITKKINFNRYPDPLAKNAIKAFSDYMGISEEYITAGNGSDELISIIINCFAEKNDSVLCLSPDFSMYRFYSFLAELKTAEITKDEHLNIDIQYILDIIKEQNPRIVIFSNPCNPTGQGISKQDVIKIINAFEGILVLDEAYMDFWNESLLDEFKSYKNLIILKTCSKAFGLAALRLGFAVASKELTNALRAAKSPFNVNTLTAEITAYILNDKAYLNACIESIKKSRDYLYNSIKRIEKEHPRIYVYPTVTNFVLIKTKNAVKIYEELLKKGIAIRCFNNMLRITAGNEEENSELLKGLQEILEGFI